MSNDNLYEETVKVASELYKRSGRIEGRDLDNWLEAERIVRVRYAEKVENQGEAIESNNLKSIEDERKGHKSLIVNGLQRSAFDFSYPKIINICVNGVGREATKRLEEESSNKRFLLLRENEKKYLTSLDLLETELKMIDAELRKASEKINQNKVRLSEIEKELIILNVQKNDSDYRKKITASISLFSFLIFIGMLIRHFKPMAFLFGFLFLGLCVYSAFKFLKSYKLRSLISRKNQENAELITDLGKLWKAESFCKNKYNQKVDMLEKQRKELEAIAAKISAVENSILTLREKEKIHYEVLEQEYDDMSIEEKRKYERRSFVKPIKYSLQDIHTGKLALTFGNGVSVDISEGGVGMITNHALKKGDILFFEEGTKINKITPIASIVRWVKEIEQNKYRAGLVFGKVCS